VYNRGDLEGISMRAIVAVAMSGAVLLLAGCDRKPTPAPLSAEANAAFLAENAKKGGVVSVPGIQYEVLKKGTGAQPERHDCVTVNYRGTLINGKEFDKTEPGKPAVFPAGRLIPGWVEALQMMHVGDKWRLVIPPGLAYGKAGAGDGLIPPDQTLVFEIELLKAAAPTEAGCV
jgi:FKBP-type peptidyl-prolyl cis-trans isomerase